MASLTDQIKNIESEIRKTPYHKGTERHIGILRAKLSKLKDKVEAKKSTKGSGGISYAIKKQGDATVVLIGPPSAGKSTLLNKLTNAKSKIAPYAFTTVSVIPGMMNYKDSYIQILDVPGLIEGAEEGKGRGREVLSVARSADLIVVMSDVERPKVLERIKLILYRNGIRINSSPPKMFTEKKLKGGILVHSNFKQEFSKETVKDIASEMGYKNTEITLKQVLSLNELIDGFSKSRVYVPAIFVLNKKDKLGKSKKKVRGVTHISAEKSRGLKELKEIIWKELGLVRVYLVRRDEKPTFDNPIIMKKGNSLLNVAEKIGAEFSESKKRAKIWGKGAKFPGQEVSLNSKVQEGLQVRFI